MPGQEGEPVPDPEPGWSPFPTAEELALGAELAALDLAQWAADLDAPVEAGWLRDGGPDHDGDEDGAAGGPGSGCTDADVLDALAGPARAVDLLAIDSLDLESLTDPVDRLRVVAALDRVIAHATARQHEVLVDTLGAEPSGAYLSERHREVELATARRSSHYAAGVAIERARALHAGFPGFAAALRAGDVSPAHTAILVEATRPIADAGVLAAIEARTLPAARRQTPGRFKTALTAAIAALDPDAAARHRAARATRRVGVRRLADGMGFLGLTHDWSTIAAIETAVRSDGRRLAAARRDTTDGDATTTGMAGPAGLDTEGLDTAGQDDEAGADACRADALVARILGQVAEDGSVTFDHEPPRIEVPVVIDLETLRREADRTALLDGQPVPAAIAREVAAAATWWRRIVTDPVTGHLLDYGTSTYLPAALRRYVFSRDGGCRSPYCTARHPDRLQLDHAIPFPDGPSDAANTGALCTTCHQLKTAGLLHLDDGTADGSVTWRTAWGQSVRVPPRSYLPDPDPPPEPAPIVEPDDPPPF